MFIAIYAVLFTLSIGAVLGVSLEQRDLSTTKEKTKTVQISCKVKGLTTDYVHWYHKKDNEEALKRILYVKKGSSPVPDNNHPDAGDFKVRIQDDNYDLNIHKLKESHSGVYYCASWERDSHSDSEHSKWVQKP
ncbi:hypothetical protein PHYPO_G00196740 [Pangasianodon hypophthalmus]|uniref:Ig-like domain-containing protein n=1 Tax=Pangasianodon hypophthalmus TaxID=310915 RepID=A0A5N5PIP4_PANHP|nr:hypothetical protein PHYPO_G00196740 [Pangasianodon hypophthalmus]